jgi:hypothetical protein
MVRLRLCRIYVLILSVPEEAEYKWWRHVQVLLPTMFFSSNISAIQALMLVTLHSTTLIIKMPAAV